MLRVVALVSLNMLDAALTVVGVSNGWLREGNPIIATMIVHLGMPVAMLVKCSIVGVAGIHMERGNGRRFVQLLIGLYVLVCAWNICLMIYLS